MSGASEANHDGEHFRAVLLAEDSVADMDELARLRAEAGVVIVDRLTEQHEGPSGLGYELGRHEPARWAYYPWRRSAVRVLGPAGFRRVRLNRNRNKITEVEQDRLDAVTIGIVGLSVGHAVAHTVALEGACGAIRLADFDALELTNLNRLPASLLDLGVNKAVIAARRIAELDPYLPIEIWHDGVTPDTVDDFIDGLDIVVDECDSLDIKLRLRLSAARQGVPVVMETSDRGLIDVERFDLEPGRAPFHGMLGDIDPVVLAGLSNRDKVPHVLKLLDAGELSMRMAASLLEVGETLDAWPQLASDVALGGATVTAAIRRIALGEPLRSGRGRIDLGELFERLASPVRDEPLPALQPEPYRVLDDPVASVAHAATRAPSGGNSQPWAITVCPDRMTFTLAPEPAPVLMDLHRRASCVAVGAALYNAKVAAAAHGILGAVHFAADAGTLFDSPVATLEFGGRSDAYLAAQYGPMLERVTNRYPTDNRLLSGGETVALHEAATQEGGRIRMVTDPIALGEYAAILAQSDRIRYLDRALRKDLVGELRPVGSRNTDSGIEVGTLGLDAAETAMLDVVLRDDVLDQLESWNLGGGLGRITADRVRGSSALVAVLTGGRTAMDYVRAGSVVESVWVRAHSLGLAVQPVSPIFLYAESRADLARLSRRHVDTLDALSRKFTDGLGIEDGDDISLVLRLGRTERPAAPSRRRSDRVRFTYRSGQSRGGR